jgi:hypothetical protein
LIWNQADQIAAFQAMLDKAPTAVAEAPVPIATPVVPVIASTPAPVVYQQQDTAHIQSASQTTSGTVIQEESLGDAARKAKQHQACLALAKDNPSIVCK